MESVILTILMILLVPIGLFLIGVILLQESKSGGLSGAFGGAGESLLGARAGRELSRWTTVGTTVFVIVLITVGILCNRRQQASVAANLPPAAVQEDEAAKSETGAKEEKKDAVPAGASTPVEGDAKSATSPAPETKPAEGAAAPTTPAPETPEAKPAEGAAVPTTPAPAPGTTSESKDAAPAPSTPSTDTQGGETK